MMPASALSWQYAQKKRGGTFRFIYIHPPQERWKMTAEQAKAESTQRAVEGERRALSVQINMEREELERAKVSQVTATSTEPLLLPLLPSPPASPTSVVRVHCWRSRSR